MTTRIIKNEIDLENLFTYMRNLKLPITVNTKMGADRSVDQNALAFKWYMEAASQGDNTSNEYRGFCKLTIGVPILRAESDEFRELYDSHFKGISYEDKLKIMSSEKFDFPVTRQMSTKQMSQYLDDVYQFFTTKAGFILTVPEER